MDICHFRNIILIKKKDEKGLCQESFALLIFPYILYNENVFTKKVSKYTKIQVFVSTFVYFAVNVGVWGQSPDVWGQSLPF